MKKILAIPIMLVAFFAVTVGVYADGTIDSPANDTDVYLTDATGTADVLIAGTYDDGTGLWAIRSNGTCPGGNPLLVVYGNTAGHTDVLTTGGGNYSFTAADLAPGQYCFAINFADGNRYTRTFEVVLDSDGDGVADVDDHCPNDGGTVNADGCPVPTSKDDCKNGGWMDLYDSAGNMFKNQGDCVSYVATQGKNLGAVAP